MTIQVVLYFYAKLPEMRTRACYFALHVAILEARETHHLAASLEDIVAVLTAKANVIDLSEHYLALAASAS